MAKILVIDDEVGPQGPHGVADALFGRKHQLIHEFSGEAGVAAFEKDRPDLILTDLRMGPGDGRYVIRSVREKDPDIFIVVHSNDFSLRHGFDIVKELIALGANAAVPKGESALLRKKVYELLDLEISATPDHTPVKTSSVVETRGEMPNRTSKTPIQPAK